MDEDMKAQSWKTLKFRPFYRLFQLWAFISSSMSIVEGYTIPHFIDWNLLYRYALLLECLLHPIWSYKTFYKLENHKVLVDDSSKILLFLNSSGLSLSRHYMTLLYTQKTTELQLLKKGVVKSWVGPLNLEKLLIIKKKHH